MKSAEPVPPKPGKSPKNVVSLPERRVERRRDEPDLPECATSSAQYTRNPVRRPMRRGR